MSAHKSGLTLYGLANCDTTRAARKWLDSNGVAYVFHDVRVDGLKRKQIEGWIAALGWEKAINKSSTTWRGLPDDVKHEISESRAVSLILEHPTLLKRPLLDDGEAPVVGFKADKYAARFSG